MAESILNGKSILAVDDEPDVLTFWRRKLRKLVQTVSLTRLPLITKQLRDWLRGLMIWLSLTSWEFVGLTFLRTLSFVIFRW